MLLANMLKNVCGCKLVEGQRAVHPDGTPIQQSEFKEVVRILERAEAHPGSAYTRADALANQN
jgi:hypothetical protein